MASSEKGATLAANSERIGAYSKVLSNVCALALLSLVAPSHASASLALSVSRYEAGKPFLAAVMITCEPGWHVYWENPGETGIPTTIQWRVPKGWRVEELTWPTPKTISSGGMVSYGYGDTVSILARITPAKGKQGTVSVDARWLVCLEACVPGSAKLSKTVRIGPKAVPDAKWKTKLTDALAKLPVKATGLGAVARETADAYELRVNESANNLQFFCLDSNVIEPEESIRSRIEGSQTVLTLPKAAFANGKTTRLKGLLVFPKRSVLIDVPIKGS